jgi:hypothetical protein
MYLFCCAFARDLGAGCLRLFGEQLVYLRRAAADAAAIVAVGDAYACALARLCGRPLIFVGTAKSVHVAAYGPAERRILRGAVRIFARDLATAVDLAKYSIFTWKHFKKGCYLLGAMRRGTSPKSIMIYLEIELRVVIQRLSGIG